MNSIDPKGEIGATKPQLWLIPTVAETAMANVLALGAKKYGVNNWRGTTVKASTYVSAMMRHMQAFRRGEEVDHESGESHLASIMANCAILLDAKANGTLDDDLQTVEVRK